MLNTIVRLTTAASTDRIESSDWTVLKDCHSNACARSQMSLYVKDFDGHEAEVRFKIPTALLIC